MRENIVGRRWFFAVARRVCRERKNGRTERGKRVAKSTTDGHTGSVLSGSAPVSSLFSSSRRSTLRIENVAPHRGRPRDIIGLPSKPLERGTRRAINIRSVDERETLDRKNSCTLRLTERFAPPNLPSLDPASTNIFRCSAAISRISCSHGLWHRSNAFGIFIGVLPAF